MILGLAKAGYLVAKGYSLLGVSSVNGTRILAFEFEGLPQIDEQLMRFVNRKAQVDAPTFAETLRSLKAMIANR